MKNLALKILTALILIATPASAFAARTQSSWMYDSSGYITPQQNPVNVLLQGTNLYLNFGTFSGTSGYGFRDNAGTMQWKNSGGAWANIGSGGGSSAGGTWSTTTSSVSGQLVNYPNNNTDIASVGSNSTTTSNYFIDPNINDAFFKNLRLTAATMTRATTTNFFATTASTTNFYGANLSGCNGGSNALTWANGLFGCNSISGGSSGDPFSHTTNYGVSVSSTNTPLWATIYSSSTNHFSDFDFRYATGTSLYASGSSTFPWLNSASSSIGTLMLTNALAGTSGGTGLSTTASSSILFGNNANGYVMMATNTIFAAGTNGNVLAYLNGSWQPTATTTFAGTAPVTAVQTGNLITIACSTCITSNAVTSVFTRTGAVTAQSGDYTTTLVTEGTNLYFTNARALTAMTGQIVQASNFFATNTAATSTFQGLAFTSATGTNLVMSGSSTFPWLNSASSSATKLLLANLGACNSATQKPIVDATGAWTCGVDANSGSSVTDFFTHPTNYGETVSATSTGMLFTGAVYASSTFIFTNATGTRATTTFLSALNASTTNLYPFNLDGVYYADRANGSDIGAQANAAYASAPITGVTIVIPGSGTSSFSTGMNFSTQNKPVRLVCPQGAVLNYTGTATATIMNNTAVGGVHNYGWGIDGCRYSGPNTDGLAPSTAAVGLQLGGTLGGEGANINNVTVVGFAKGLVIGDNAWNFTVTNSGFVYNGRNLVSECTSNCGEGITIIGSKFVDSYSSLPHLGDKCVDLSQGNISSILFTDDVFDDCGIYVGAGTLTATFEGGQMENPGSVFWSKYWYIQIATSTNTQVTVSNMTIMNDASSGDTANEIFQNGGTLNVVNTALYAESSVSWPLMVYNDTNTSRFNASNVSMQSLDATSPLTAISNVSGNCSVPTNGQQIRDFGQVNAKSPSCEPIDTTGNKSLYVGSALFRFLNSGNIGVGTTSPYSAFAVNGQIVGLNYVATSTTATSTFAAAITVGAGQGTSTFAGGISATRMSQTATSTGSKGWDITGGCFSVNGTCVGSGGSTLSVGGTGAIQYANGTAFAGDNTKLYFNSVSNFMAIGTTSAFAELSIQKSFGNNAPFFDIASTTSATNSTTSVMRVEYDNTIKFGAAATSSVSSKGYLFDTSAGGATTSSYITGGLKLGTTSSQYYNQISNIGSVLTGYGPAGGDNLPLVYISGSTTNSNIFTVENKIGDATMAIRSSAGYGAAYMLMFATANEYNGPRIYGSSDSFAYGFGRQGSSDGYYVMNSDSAPQQKWYNTTFDSSMRGGLTIGTTTDSTGNPTFARLGVQGKYGTNIPIFDVATTTTSSGAATTSVFRVLYDGKVGIGTTTPYAKLSIVAGTSESGTRNADIFAVASSTPTATTTHFRITSAGTIFAPNTTSSGSAQTGYWCYDANGQMIRDTAVCIVSARKFKKDIEPLNIGLSELLKVQPVQYYLKTPFGKDDARQQMGVIADDIAKIDDRLVTHDSAGNIHGFNYLQYTAWITKSIQDFYGQFQHLVARVSGLEDRVNAQQKQIDSLQAQINALRK